MRTIIAVTSSWLTELYCTLAEIASVLETNNANKRHKGKFCEIGIEKSDTVFAGSCSYWTKE